MSKPVCIITGAGRGIGEATARMLDTRGYALLLVSRTAADIEKVAASLSSARALPADVSLPAEAQRIVDFCRQQFGRIDALVNNAGSAPVVPLEKTTDEIWQQVMETNLGGAFRLTRAVWPIFQAQRHGVIVNLSSLASRDPFLGFTAYAAAKAGVNLFSTVAAREGAPYNIQVHTVAPGAVETRMLRDAFPASMVPADRTLAPDDIADILTQCVTGELRHTSGEVLWVHR